MFKKRIVDYLKSETQLSDISIKAWVRTRRDAKGVSFLELNDGSCLKNLQVVVTAETLNFESVLKQSFAGTSLEVSGNLVASKGDKQAWELLAQEIKIIGFSDPTDYPLQKKRHSDEFLRDHAHLRPRTNKYGAIFRLRSECSFAIHNYFRKHGFYYLQTPIITASDCEGAGEMFRVTHLEPNAKVNPKEPYKDDFFGKFAGLTVSGQLNAEPFALALGRVYTFGPTFRAENSNTPRHAAEFWMLEPEVAFFDLFDNMNLAEDLVKYLIKHCLENCHDDLALFDKFVEPGLLEKLKSLTEIEYLRIPYEEALNILLSSGEKFEYPISYGADLQTEHERYLCEKHFKKPLFVYDYPRTLKPFYMRVGDDGKTVAAMDLLVPKIGELIGGSQREERFHILRDRMEECGLAEDEYWWYIDTRRWGSAPHSGFGMGFERFLMMLTGVSNIRDVIAYPRTPKKLEF